MKSSDGSESSISCPQLSKSREIFAFKVEVSIVLFPFVLPRSITNEIRRQKLGKNSRWKMLAERSNFPFVCHSNTVLHEKPQKPPLESTSTQKVVDESDLNFQNSESQTNFRSQNGTKLWRWYKCWLFPRDWRCGGHSSRETAFAFNFNFPRKNDSLMVAETMWICFAPVSLLHSEPAKH